MRYPHQWLGRALPQVECSDNPAGHVLALYSGVRAEKRALASSDDPAVPHQVDVVMVNAIVIIGKMVVVGWRAIDFQRTRQKSGQLGTRDLIIWAKKGVGGRIAALR